MSMIAQYSDRALPRLSKRDFTLCKAAILVGLMTLGHLSMAARADDAGSGQGTWKSAFCDEIVTDRTI